MTTVRWLAAAVCVIPLGAWAQVDAGTPAPKPKPPVAAAAASPRSQNRGLGNAKDEDEPLAHGPIAFSRGDSDPALLRALLFAFEPAPTEIRVIAIEDLGILGDPRALNPLAQLVMDPNVTVQLAALRSISSIQHPRAEAILANIVRHPAINETVKLAAIDALLFQNTRASITFLQSLASSASFHPTLRQRARTVLLDLPPAAAPGVETM